MTNTISDSRSSVARSVCQRKSQVPHRLLPSSLESIKTIATLQARAIAKVYILLDSLIKCSRDVSCLRRCSGPLAYRSCISLAPSSPVIRQPRNFVCLRLQFLRRPPTNSILISSIRDHIKRKGNEITLSGEKLFDLQFERHFFRLLGSRGTCANHRKIQQFSFPLEQFVSGTSGQPWEI